MSNKYGIYQTSSKSCVFYKEDKDGNQSTFNIFITPVEGKKNIFAFIDNEQLKQKNWLSKDKSDIKEVMEAFGGWAADAPIVFEMEAHRSLSNCLQSVLKNEEEE